jgi:hypothetical protein
MSQPDETVPAPEADEVNTYFTHVSHWDGRWRFSTTEDNPPLATLVGCTVNIGDKDGGVYEGVTVTAVDERTGQVTVTGGGFGVRFRDDEARPFEGTRTIAAHDIARGFIRPQGRRGQPC